MTGMTHVKPGDPLRIPAQTYNAMVDAARATRSGASGLASSGIPGQHLPAADVVLVRNDSGVAQDRFDVLGIDEPIILPADNEPEWQRRIALSCVTPAVDTHEGRFVVLLEPLADGAIGRAAAGGVVHARVDVPDLDFMNFAEITDGETGYLTAGAAGSAVILWIEDVGSTEYPARAIVRLGVGATAGADDWPRLAEIIDEGPESEEDYGDERFWVRTVNLVAGDPVYDGDLWVTAVELGALTWSPGSRPHTHRLPENLVWLWYRNSTYVFLRGPNVSDIRIWKGGGSAPTPYFRSIWFEPLDGIDIVADTAPFVGLQATALQISNTGVLSIEGPDGEVSGEITFDGQAVSQSGTTFTFSIGPGLPDGLGSLMVGDAEGVWGQFTPSEGYLKFDSGWANVGPIPQEDLDLTGIATQAWVTANFVHQ